MWEQRTKKSSFDEYSPEEQEIIERKKIDKISLGRILLLVLLVLRIIHGVINIWL